MIEKVKRYIQQNDMLQKGSHVIVGLSGGADSVALTHFLHTHQEQYDIHLSAAHVNHKIRKSADDDESFARAFCLRFGMKFHSMVKDVPALSKEKNQNLEATARSVRYDYFQFLDKNACVATAHTLSDQAETVLFNLTRGSGLNGLTGIPPVRGNIIRPFLECTRAEIESYCQEYRLPYVVDETNFSMEYSRNFLRHEVIPKLEKINPAFLGAIRRTVTTLVEDEATLSGMAEIMYNKAKLDNGFDLEELKRAPLAIRKRGIARILYDEIELYPEYNHIEAVNSLIEKGSGTVQVLRDTKVRVRRTVLEFPQKETTLPWSVQLRVGETQTPAGVLDVSVFESSVLASTQKIYNNRLAIYFDYDKIVGSVKVRSRMSGDAFSPTHFDGTKSVKKILSESDIVPEKRNLVPIVYDAVGIIGMYGAGEDKRLAVTDDTKRILFLNFGGVQFDE